MRGLLQDQLKLWAGAALALTIASGIGGCAQTGDLSSNPLRSSPSSNNTGVDTTEYPLYELRTYTTNPGKLDALHARFRNHTQRLFEQHGIQNIAYWTPTDKPNTLVYIVAHKDRESAAAAWAAFVADPEWQSVYAASIAGGKLVVNIDSVFMAATDYSPAL